MIRGADVLARALDRAGLTNIFTLSGNHIMPIFDAAIGTRLNLIHVRHEGAAVHMADAWGRLSGMPGIGSPYETANPRLAGLRCVRISGFPRYLVFYRSLEENIEVVRVLHGSRDIKTILEEGDE